RGGGRAAGPARDAICLSAVGHLLRRAERCLRPGGVPATPIDLNLNVAVDTDEVFDLPRCVGRLGSVHRNRIRQGAGWSRRVPAPTRERLAVGPTHWDNRRVHRREAEGSGGVPPTSGSTAECSFHREIVLHLP